MNSVIAKKEVGTRRQEKMEKYSCVNGNETGRMGYLILRFLLVGEAGKGESYGEMKEQDGEELKRKVNLY